MNKKPKGKRHLPTELEAVLLTSPDLVAYYLKEEYQLENLLNRLENEARAILNRAGHSTTIGDILRSLNRNPLPYFETEEYAAYVLLASYKLRKAISINDAKQAVVQTLVIFSAATQSGLGQVIVQGISTVDGRSKGGQVAKREPAFGLLLDYVIQNSKRKSCLAMWGFITKKLAIFERSGQKIIDGYDFVCEEKTNKITLYFEDPKKKSREMGYRSFQRRISDFKKDLKKISTK